MKKFFTQNRSRYLLIIPLIVLGSFLIGHFAHAGLGDFIAEMLSWIIYGIIWVLGKLLMLVMWCLILIVQYNNFINAEPVTYGWSIVRDVCNMFFILILLIIAFATILRVEQYSFKRLLPKLILMAVLINFSKLICGIFIDFAQVIMLTFVNGFKDIGEGNLNQMLGIDGLMDMGEAADGGGDVDSWSILGTYMLALVYVIISLITIITMIAVVAMRIIMLWVYIVLSPLAYLLATFPPGEKYASKWWEEFSNNLIVGPILAFFIWLSFVSLGGTTTPDVDAIMANSKQNQSQVEGLGSGSSTMPSVGLTQAGSTEHMMKFVISIAMLIGGLQISQQLGGAAGGMAGKGFGALKGLGAKAASGGRRLAVGAGRRVGRGARNVAMGAASGMALGSGKALEALGKSKALEKTKVGSGMQTAGRGMAGVGRFGMAWRSDLMNANKKERQAKREQFLKKVGIGEKSADIGSELLGKAKAKTAGRIGKNTLQGAALGAAVGPAGMLVGAGLGAAFGKAKGMFSKKALDGAKKYDESKKQKERGEYLKTAGAAGGEIDQKIANGQNLKNQGNIELGRAQTNLQNWENELSNRRANGAPAKDIKEASETVAMYKEEVSAAQNKITEGQKLESEGIKDKNDTANADQMIKEGLEGMNKNKMFSAAGHNEATGKTGVFAQAQDAIAKALNDVAKKIDNAPFEFTRGGMKKISAETKNAREDVRLMSQDNNWLQDSDKGDHYSSTGLNSAKKARLDQLASTENPHSAQATANLIGSINQMKANPTEKNKAVLENFSKSIAAYEKGGNPLGNLSKVKSALAAGTPAFDPDSFKDKVKTNYRSTGLETEKGEGKFHINTFANNTNNEAGKNIVGVDFKELKDMGVDVDTEAEANYNTGNIEQITNALQQKITQEKTRLNQMKASGKVGAGADFEMDQADFDGRMKDLDMAENKISQGGLKDVTLVNTASKNYQRQERLASVYHEQIHEGGVDDEDLTESLAKTMMSNKLYGRNAQTGGRHAVEIGKMAGDLKQQGVSNEEIITQVTKEIENRRQGESKSRAEMVLKMEKGEKETVTQYINESSGVQSDAYSSQSKNINNVSSNVATGARTANQKTANISEQNTINNTAASTANTFAAAGVSGSSRASVGGGSTTINTDNITVNAKNISSAAATGGRGAATTAGARSESRTTNAENISQTTSNRTTGGRSSRSATSSQSENVNNNATTNARTTNQRNSSTNQQNTVNNTTAASAPRTATAPRGTATAGARSESRTTNAENISQTTSNRTTGGRSSRSATSSQSENVNNNATTNARTTNQRNLSTNQQNTVNNTTTASAPRAAAATGGRGTTTGGARSESRTTADKVMEKERVVEKEVVRETPGSARVNTQGEEVDINKVVDAIKDLKENLGGKMDDLNKKNNKGIIEDILKKNNDQQA